MILLWGVPEDGPIRAVSAVLERQRRRYRLIDQFEVADWSCTIRLDANVSGCLRYKHQTIDLDRVRSFYLRPYETARVANAAGQTDLGSMGHAERFNDALLMWSELTEARVINRPSNMASNSSKPYQAALIREVGFDTPATLITSDRDAALGFRAEHGSVIFKSLSGVRSRVTLADNAFFSRLRAPACPIQLQEHIRGLDYRVHVVGDEVFACRIDSLSTDYRYPGEDSTGPDIQTAEIPENVAERCVALARRLDLVLTGIDLRRADDGRWICFEANPSPGYTYYEESTGAPLSEAVAALLTRGVPQTPRAAARTRRPESPGQPGPSLGVSLVP